MINTRTQLLQLKGRTTKTVEQAIVRYWGRKSRRLAETYIKRFTKPNEIVADYFGGSGVFVKTALELRRKAVYVDLNPFAHLIAKSTIRKCDFKQFASAANGILSQDEITIRKPGLAKVSRDDLFSIRCKCGKKAQVFTVIYHRRYRKSGKPTNLTGLQLAVYKSIARRKVMFHEDLVALHPELSTQVLSYVVKWLVRHKLVKESDFPERANFVSKCVCGRDHLRLRGRLKWIVGGRIRPAGWYPKSALEYPGGTRFLKKRDAERVGEFFTERNLAALTWLWHSIEKAETARDARDCLKLAFMGTLVRSSKMCRPKGGPWPINSFWIPRTYAVRNPFVIFKNVIRQMLKMLEVESNVSAGGLPKLLEGDADITFLQSDSTKLLLPRNSVDYVIIDPPHTSEVQYFELSSFYTSWLGRKLDYKNELTINSKQGKDIKTYMKMLKRASLGIYSSLKNGGHYTVILHEAELKVLDRCVDAICDAGFRFLEKRKVDEYTVYTFKKNPQGLRKWLSSN